MIQARSNGSTEGDEFVRRFCETRAQQEANTRFCIDWLIRQHKVAAIHPDDGWVDRASNVVKLCYPAYQRRDTYQRAGGDLEVGDIIALGGPNTELSPRGAYRLVRVVEVIPSLFKHLGGLTGYRFEQVKEVFDIHG